jgi:hypothetical protein
MRSFSAYLDDVNPGWRVQYHSWCSTNRATHAS